jgi:protein Mpv17
MAFSQRLAATWKRHAFVLGSCATGCKTSIADILVQKQYEGKKEIDWKRNFVFASFGLFYLGAFQYVQYTIWFPRFLPGTHWTDVAKRVCFDQTINTGLWYYPLFYVVQSMVMNNAFDQQRAEEGLQRYRNNIASDMMNCWQLWIPFQSINFSIVPIHLRVPFAAGVSFVWSCILSALRGNMTEPNSEANVNSVPPKQVVEPGPYHEGNDSDAPLVLPVIPLVSGSAAL